MAAAEEKIKKPEPAEKAKKAGKQKKKKRKKRRKGAGLGVAIFLISLVAVGALLYYFLQVDEIQVRGNEDISRESVIEMSGVKTGTHLWLVDKKAAVEALKNNPYIKSVSIIRVYPNILRIVISERKARAVVVGMAAFATIDNEGHILAIDRLEGTETLLRVTGIGASGFQVNGNLGEMSDYTARALVNILAAIDGSGLTDEIVSLDLSNTLSVFMTTASGYRVQLGQPEEAAAKMDKLKLVLPQLKRLGCAGGTVNLSAAGDPTYSPENTPQPAPSEEPSGTPGPEDSPGLEETPMPLETPIPDETQQP